jgi:hypothetical protein
MTDQQFQHMVLKIDEVCMRPPMTATRASSILQLLCTTACAETHAALMS